ncbi:kremen protein 2 [Rhinophrynus dorsalis]
MMILLLFGFVLLVRSEVTLPELSECFTVNGRDYRGTVSHAGPEGTPCLYWNQTTEHMYNSQSDPTGDLGLGNHNHCRNPDADVQPWCYVSETEDGIYWKYCDIPACHMPGYIGCFLDFGSPPALSGVSGTSSKLTIQTCIRLCRDKGYQYAGLEAGYACFCGLPSDVATLHPVSTSQCDQACFGRASELCGGDGKLSIYSAWVGACSGTLSSLSGVLYSPDFPEDYGPGVWCSWDILPPSSAAVELHFHNFQVLNPNDVLELRDGAKGSLFTQIRGGQKAPTSVTLPTGHLQITFRSDAKHSGPGYAITYRGLATVQSSNLSWLPNPVASPTPLYGLSEGISMESPNSTSKQNRAKLTTSTKEWILLAAALSLLIVSTGYLLWRLLPSGLGAGAPGVGEQTSSCSILYRKKKGQRGDLTSVNQSSMKSLL